MPASGFSQRLRGTLVALLALLAPGCTQHGRPISHNAAPPVAASLHFTDVTPQSGIKFTHRHGGNGRHYFVEFMAGGCAFLDYDGDGWEDALLVQGAPLPGYKGPRPLHAVLLHTNRNGSFTDVARGSGLDIQMYGLGVTVGDYDNDGRPDIYLTALGGNHLFHNEGRGRFRDVTRQAGVAGSDLSTSAMWLDIDNDGQLDLFVCRYTDYSLRHDLPCKGPNGIFKYCRPTAYQPTHPLLFHNNGNGTFSDLTATSGLSRAVGRSLGVAPIDYNEDGWMDIYVANDITTNFLLTNQGNGTFREESVQRGAAVGYTYGGMGVDSGDYRNEGHQGLVVANFSHQPISLYRNLGKGVFTEDGGVDFQFAGLRYVKWGCRFADFDLDGFQDYFLVNGDVDVDIGLRNTVRGPGADRQPCQLFRNVGGQFTDVSATAGSFFRRQQVGRGAAFGDYDNDGRTDVLIACNNEPAILLHNDTQTHNHWLRLTLVGSARPGVRGCNRDALGTSVRVTTDATTQTQYVRSGTSYLADHDRRLVFGIGQAPEAAVEIRWPCGTVQKLHVKAGQQVTVNEAHCRLRSTSPQAH
jgi:hypothetical protein